MGFGRKCRWRYISAISPDSPRIITILAIDAMIIRIGWLLIHMIIGAKLGTSAQRVLIIVFGGVL